MPSYLEIALRVACPAQAVHSEPTPDARAATERVENQSHSPALDVADSPQAQSNGSALCGSPRCAGCYNVGEGRKIHPPKIGEDYRNWLERWKPKGKLQ
jgi:hypothetical protein